MGVGVGGPAGQVVQGDVLQRADPLGVVIQAGDVVKRLAARVQKGFARFLADFFQRFQAVAGEAGAQHFHTARATAGKSLQRGFGGGFEPLGFAKARLEGNAVGLGRQAQVLGQQARGFARLAVVGVAQVQRAFGHAVKAHHEVLCAPVGLPVRLHAGGQGRDVAGVVVVALHIAQLGHMALAQGPGTHRVAHAGGGGAGILWVQRQHQNARGPRRLECVKLARNGGLAVAHGGLHQHVVAAALQRLLQQLRLRARPGQQGRALLCPDAGVFGRRLGRARAQDDAVQDGQPQQARQLHHAWITQKLPQVAAHRRRGGGLGGAQVAQQNRRARRLAMLVGWFGSEAWGEGKSHGSDCGKALPCLRAWWSILRAAAAVGGVPAAMN